jgi:thiamine pyrophosphokinase
VNAVIIANGELQDDARLRELWQRAELRIAANGGALNARQALELPPQIVIGDFDSLDDVTRAWLEKNFVEFIRHPREKDETDLELALFLALKRGAKHVTIIGAFGGREDQSLANAFLLTRWPHLRITDAASEMWAAKEFTRVRGTPGDLVSLVPIDKRVAGIKTQGLEYPLHGETLERGSTRGISNVMLEAEAEIRWQKGWMIIVHFFKTSSEQDLGLNRSIK